MGAFSCKQRPHCLMDEETEGEGLTHQGGVWLQGPLLFHRILWGQDCGKPEHHEGGNGVTFFCFCHPKVKTRLLPQEALA